MSCCQAAMFQGIVERMTKELTALGSTHDDDQDGCSAREKALGIDWRIGLVFPQHFAAGVDLEGRVRWILPDHRPLEVLLNSPVAVPHFGTTVLFGD